MTVTGVDEFTAQVLEVEFHAHPNADCFVQSLEDRSYVHVHAVIELD